MSDKEVFKIEFEDLLTPEQVKGSQGKEKAATAETAVILADSLFLDPDVTEEYNATVLLTGEDQ